MRIIIGLMSVAGLMACDVKEKPSEEAREAQEAIRDNRSPEQIRDQLDDIPSSRNNRTPAVNVDTDYERDLRKAEEWLEESRRDLDAGTRKADAEFDKALDALEQDLRKARADFDKLPATTGAEAKTLSENLKDELHRISVKIDSLDGEVDDKPGKDPVGPG